MRQVVGNLQHRDSSRGIIVGAIEDCVRTGARLPDHAMAKMVVVGADDDVFRR